MPGSRSSSPRVPRSLRNPARATFTTDRPCPVCEYNLIGLGPGMACPECGTPIVTPITATAQDENLASAPRWYLVILAWSLAAMSAAAIVGVIMLIQRRPAEINGVIVAGTLAALVWAAGIFIVTQPRPQAVARAISPRMQQRHARWIARLTQLGWLAYPVGHGLAAQLQAQAITAAAVTGAAVASSPLINTLIAGAWAGAGLAILGLLVVCYLLADLAEWAADSALAERLRMAGLGLPLGTPVALISLALYPRMGPIMLVGIASAVVSSIAAVLSAGVLILGVCQLAYLSFWAIKNQEHYEEVLEHRDQRRREHHEEMAARLNPTPIAPQPNLGKEDDNGVPSPLSPGGEGPLIIPASEHVIPRSAKAAPYDLAEEEPGPTA